MNIFKEISTYKWVGLLILAGVGFTTVYYYNQLILPCIDISSENTFCLFDEKEAIYKPIYWGGKILFVILCLSLLIPVHIFKKWLLYILPPILLITFYLVQDISVYSSGILYISRAQMAENSMFFLAVITVIFVAAHLIYDWRKKKNLVKK